MEPHPLRPVASGPGHEGPRPFLGGGPRVVQKPQRVAWRLSVRGRAACGGRQEPGSRDQLGRRLGSLSCAVTRLILRTRGPDSTSQGGLLQCVNRSGQLSGARGEHQWLLAAGWPCRPAPVPEPRTWAAACSSIHHQGLTVLTDPDPVSPGRAARPCPRARRPGAISSRMDRLDESQSMPPMAPVPFLFEFL